MNDYGIKYFVDIEGYQIDRVEPIRIINDARDIIDITVDTYSSA